MAGVILGGAGCVADPGDCSPHPVQLGADASASRPSVVLASSCSRLVVVSDVPYINQGEYALLDDVIGRLEVHGRITHVNVGWAFEIESPEDLTVWRIEGVDPGLGLWGTSAELRGTNRYVLWTIDNCSEIDACEPPICDQLDLTDAPAAERCGAQQKT